ncbi:MAG: hypothetical protein LC792_15065, partial [Actinobacteria bacterium]|nr:hypothetical protein [Actinomycetota bacterium]
MADEGPSPREVAVIEAVTLLWATVGRVPTQVTFAAWMSALDGLATDAEIVEAAREVARVWDYSRSMPSPVVVRDAYGDRARRRRLAVPALAESTETALAPVANAGRVAALRRRRLGEPRIAAESATAVLESTLMSGEAGPEG